MSCNHNCNQGRTCNCKKLDKQDHADLMLFIAFLAVIIGFAIWSLI